MKHPTSLLSRGRRWFCAAAIFAVATAGLALPAAAVEKEQVRKMLRGYEWKLKPESFTQFGEGVDEALMAIVSDPEAMPAYFRQRALVALRLYGNDVVADFLESVATSPTGKFLARRAFESFASAFAASRPARVEALAASLLNRGDPHLRVAAARALRTLGTATAETRFSAYLSSEPEAWARRQARK